jgi:hemin uptake protein HemP
MSALSTPDTRPANDAPDLRRIQIMIITVNIICSPNREIRNWMLLDRNPNFPGSKRGYLRDMIGAPEPPAETNTPHSPDAGAETIRRYPVADLLQGSREAILVHGGSEYRLRITGNGKLILTK